MNHWKQSQPKLERQQQVMQCYSRVQQADIKRAGDSIMHPTLHRSIESSNPISDSIIVPRLHEHFSGNVDVVDPMNINMINAHGKHTSAKSATASDIMSNTAELLERGASATIIFTHSTMAAVATKTKKERSSTLRMLQSMSMKVNAGVRMRS
jgi:hypothetical protein